jgi:hypothetical protein
MRRSLRLREIFFNLPIGCVMAHSFECGSTFKASHAGVVEMEHDKTALAASGRDAVSVGLQSAKRETG